MTPEERLTLAYAERHPLEAARTLEALEPAEAAGVLAPLPPAVIAGVMEFLAPEANAALLRRMPGERGRDVLAALGAAPAIAALRRLEPGQREALLEGLDPWLGSRLSRALAYAEGTAGSLADPFVLTLPADIPVAEALERVRRQHRSATHYQYVLGAGARLAGVTSLKRLLVAAPSAAVTSVSDTRVVTLPAAATLPALVQTPHWRQFHILPVVDRGGVFLGALRLRTLRQVEAAQLGGADAGSLSAAMMRLWELYATTGLGLMTRLADAVAAGLGPGGIERGGTREGERP